MDLGKALLYFTEDEDWLKKVAIGAGITFVAMLFSWALFIPVFLMVAIFLGYELAITRNVLNGEEKPLPEWDNFGAFLSDGLWVLIARLVYALPIILVSCIGGIMMIPLVDSGNGEPNPFFFVVVCCLVCVSLLFGILIWLLTPAIHIQYIRHGNLGACFHIGEIISLTREHIGDVGMYTVGMIAVGFITMAVNTFLGWTIVVPLATQYWRTTVSGHLVGQIVTRIEGKEVAYDI